MSTPVFDKSSRKVKPKRARGPWSRVQFIRFDEKADRLVYRHPTKGLRSRKYTQSLAANLMTSPA